MNRSMHWCRREEFTEIFKINHFSLSSGVGSLGRFSIYAFCVDSTKVVNNPVVLVAVVVLCKTVVVERFLGFLDDLLVYSSGLSLCPDVLLKSNFCHSKMILILQVYLKHQ